MKRRYVMFYGVLIVFSMVFIGTSVANAPVFEGEPVFTIFLQPARYGPALEPFQILVAMGGNGVSNNIGRGAIQLGPGLSWVSGKRSCEGHLLRAPTKWYIEASAAQAETTEIRATLSVELEQGRVDETEAVLPIVVAEGGLHFGISRIVRAETVREGQRFRYGGQFLVPIETSERVMSVDIVEKPKSIIQEPAVYEGSQPANRELPFVVFVGRDGRVKSSHLLPGRKGTSGATAEMIQAAVAALERWRFTPARTRSGPVADWIVVSVPIQGKAQPR